MSSGEQGNVPGGYVGRPTNHAEKAEEAQADVAGEQMPATTRTPGDYFVGRPSQHQQQEQVQQQDTNQSTPSFLARCCPCLAGGGAAD